MNENPLYLIRKAIKNCLSSYLSNDISIKVNFENDEFKIYIKCKNEEISNVKKAYKDCWVINQLKTKKSLYLC